MASVQKVSISIDVTADNAQPAIQGVTQSLNKMGEAGAVSGAKIETAAKAATQSLTQMGEAGVTTGAKMQQAMAGTGAAARASSMDLEALRARQAAVLEQMNAWKAAPTAPMAIFNQQVQGFSKQGMGGLAAQEAALAATNRILKDNANAAAGAAKGYGELRVAMGAMTGNARQMELGLATLGGRLKGLGSLFQAAFPVIIGIGMVGVVVQMGEAVYQLYEKWLDVDGAIDRYNDKAAQAAEKQFFQNAGIDELNRDLKLANQQVDELQKKQATAPGLITYAFATGHRGGGYLAASQIIQHPLTMSDASQLNTAHGKSDQDRLRMLEEIHKRNLQQIEDKKAIAEAGTKSATEKNLLERRAADKAAAETLTDTLARQELLHQITSRPTGLKPGDKGYFAPVAAPTGDAADLGAMKNRIAELDKLPLSTTGSAARQMAEAHAAAQFETSRRENAKTTDAEILRIHREADEASLTGIQLLEYKRKAADADWLSAHKNDLATAAAINQNYYVQEAKLAEQERKQRQQDEQQAAGELRRMRDETSLGGLGGAARIEQEGKNKIGDFYSQNHPGMNPGERLAYLHQITQQTQQSLARETQSFADEVSGVLDRTVDRSLVGFARIHADADAQVAKFRSDAAREHGSPQELAIGIAGVRKNEAGDIAALNQRNNEQTEALEARARSLYLSSEKQQTAAIGNEFEERTRKFKEEAEQQIGSGKLTTQDLASIWENYNRRVVAAGQIRDAELAKSAREARDKMAGEFTSFFHGLDHPTRMLAEMGDKVAGQMAASLVQRYQNRGATHGAGHGEQLSMGSTLDSVFGRIAGKPSGATAGAEELGIAGPTTSAKKSIALATAEIFVQNASIGFAGAGFRGAGGAGRVIGSAGTLLATSSAAGAPGGFAGGFAGAGELASTPPGASSQNPFGYGGWTGGSPGGGEEPGVTGGGKVNSVVGGARQVMGFGQEMAGMFGGHSSGGGASSRADAAGMGGAGGRTRNGGMLDGGGFKSNVGGAIGGTLGLYSAYEGKGGFSGAASGALSGMKLGMAVGGPIGAGIGAAAGAIIGAIGFGAKEQARVYDLKTIRPRIAQDVQAYETGGMTYLSAYADMQSLMTEAKNATNKMGSGAQRYYQDTMKPEFSQAEAHFSAMEKAGRSNFTMATAQYAIGSDYVPRDGMAVIHEGERIFPSDQNERITKAIEGGADSRYMAASTGFGGDVHLHVHTMDAKGVSQFLDANKHHIRASLNKSFAENSGGADGF